ncbi:MAG: glycosyltransferase family 1 protein [Propionibacterium sp.]|nr:glycosyltransferase family 1 protein [Propionibacterium sp.]
MRIAIKYGTTDTGNERLIDPAGAIHGHQAGPVLVRRLLNLFEPAILIGTERAQVNGYEVLPLDEIDAENTVVINMDVIDSTEVWGVLHTTAAEPKVMNFVWWNASEEYHHLVNQALLGLSFALFPTFANSERTASEVREIVEKWTIPRLADRAELAWSKLGVHLGRVQPRRETTVPVVLYPAIYVHGRKRPWDFIDAVTAVAKRTPLKVEMRLHHKHLTSEPAMEMSTRQWAWVGPLTSTREGYWEALAGTTAFLATATEESYGLGYVEAMVSGAIGIFPDREWVPQLLPEGYPFIYRNLAEAEEMLYRAVTDTDACRAELDELVGGSFVEWVRENHDDTAFEAAMKEAVADWFGWQRLEAINEA